MLRLACAVRIFVRARSLGARAPDENIRCPWLVPDIQQQLPLNRWKQVVVAQGAIAFEWAQRCQYCFRPMHFGHDDHAVQFHHRRCTQFDQLVVQFENQPPVGCAPVLGASVGCGNRGLYVVRSNFGSFRALVK